MFTGKILDPIHGTIDTTEIEKWIIQQKSFNRLRRIKQNTLLNYVFPGANHTRFEHSIGVMHIAEQIFEKSNENVTIAKLKDEKYSSKNNFTSIIDICSENNFDIDVLKQELRLAALLHDIGHGPTSHKFDDFTIIGSQLMDILETKSMYFEEYLDIFKNYLSRDGRSLNKKVEHEIISCVFIIKLIKDLKQETKFNSKSLSIIKKLSVNNIIKMIEPAFDEHHEIKIGDQIVTDYFNSIISSFPIDADRMDYLYRDSFYSGVKYGFYDLSRILMSILPIKFNDRYTLGIKSSGLDSVIRFIQSRNHLYNQVYFHKTNCSTNTMLDFIFRHLHHKSVLDQVHDYDSFEDFYWKNSDEYFFNNTLKKILEDDGCDICEDGCIENDVLDELLERKLWKRIYENRITLDNEESFKTAKINEERLNEIKSRLEKEHVYINVNYSSNAGLKGFSKSKIVILDKNMGYTPKNNWSSYNKELEFLYQTNTFITRIYLRKNFDTAKEYEEIKERVLKQLKNENLID